jgi:hypothetical protein
MKLKNTIHNRERALLRMKEAEEDIKRGFVYSGDLRTLLTKLKKTV